MRADIALSAEIYGIGVGPGDPGLLTIEAARALAAVDIVFAPAPRAGETSLAWEIARAAGAEKAELRLLSFPMSRDATERAVATLYKDRSIYIFRYLARFLANPTTGVMDHDLVITPVSENGQTSYVVVQRNGMAGPVGCMECNFSVIQNYLRLRQLHPKPAAT